MHEDEIKRICLHTDHIAAACGISCCVLDLERQDCARSLPPVCLDCPYAAAGQCSSKSVHLFGSLQAERWSGLYIYHCPAALGFVSSIIYAGGAPALSVIGGPAVLGSPGDYVGAASLLDEEMLSRIPAMEPTRFTHISLLISDLSGYLSAPVSAGRDERAAENARLNNRLYDLTVQFDQSGEYAYPLALEKKLSEMIARGDKSGARETINDLLGHLYFTLGGDITSMKDHAAGLVLLFSRTSIEGGADARRIFGEIRGIMERIRACADLDELSPLLTQVFHRFVGYVFDFAGVKHVGVIRKAVEFIRANYMRRITLEEVAAQVYLSKSYLSTVFNDEMGCSVTSYINSLRLARSRELLLDSELPIVDICNLVGFDNQSYFTKVFRAAVGVSPGKYRKARGKV